MTDTLGAMIVVAGVLHTADHYVLISTRPAGKASAGLWEFAGGKVEQGESHQQALIREFEEELGLDIRPYTAQLFHSVHQAQLSLYFYLLDVPYRLNAEALEGQQLNWVKIKDLSQYAFPASNAGLIDKLQEKFC